MRGLGLSIRLREFPQGWRGYEFGRVGPGLSLCAWNLRGCVVLLCACGRKFYATRELQFAAAFHGAGHCDFVGVFDVAAGGDAGGDAGDFDVKGAEGGGEPGGCGFAFEGGAGGEDDFVDFAVLDAGEEVGGAELVGADAVERGECAVEDVVDALVAAGALNGGDAGGLLDDADEALVADGGGTVGAGIDIGDVVADGAEAEAGFEGVDGVGEGGGVFLGGAEDVEGEALGGFGADAGKFFEFVDEAGERLCVTGHGLRVAEWAWVLRAYGWRRLGILFGSEGKMRSGVGGVRVFAANV